MFSLASSTILALALTSSVAASSNSFARLSRHHNLVARTTPPKGWATGYLENYQVYHERYTAISCENKHGTEFFDLCCHPMLATETLEKNRAACCAPGSKAQCPSTSSSSAAAPVPSAADEEDDEDCGDEDDSGNADVDTGDAGDDDQDAEDCDDEDEGDDDETTSHTVARSTSSNDDSTSTIHTTPKPITTSTATTHSTAKVATTHSTAKVTTVPETSTKTASTSNDNAFITGGFGTWFTQNGVAGACGTKHKDTDFVVAVPTKNYAKGTNCGRHVRIVDIATGKSAEAVVADECPTCDNDQCLDMSVALFKQFATLGVGEFAIKYQYLD
jgi:hypothetical protein